MTDTPYPWDHMDQIRALAREGRSIDECAYLLKGARGLIEMGRFKLPEVCGETMDLLAELEDRLESIEVACRQTATERLEESYKTEEALALKVTAAAR